MCSILPIKFCSEALRNDSGCLRENLRSSLLALLSALGHRRLDHRVASLARIQKHLLRKNSVLSIFQDMATTVEAGFREFLLRLTPLGGESEAAKNHRASIESCLKSTFEILRFFRTGSFGNGTSIRSYSDVDYFASMPTENVKQDSQSTLRDVRDALAARFPATGVVVRTPAVLVPFGKDASESTEVVPADLASYNGGKQIYDIPNRSGGWMKSSPNTHNSYVAEVNSKLDEPPRVFRRLGQWTPFSCRWPSSL